jgi:hypothetical protein
VNFTESTGDWTAKRQGLPANSYSNNFRIRNLNVKAFFPEPVASINSSESISNENYADSRRGSADCLSCYHLALQRAPSASREGTGPSRGIYIILPLRSNLNKVKLH